MGHGTAWRVTQAPSIYLRGTYNIDGRRLFGPIDICVAGANWTCVLGRSGVGKSTVLRLVAGLACAGEFNGTVMASDGAPLLGRVSVMAQFDLLLPWLSALENTVLGARLRGQEPDFERARMMLGRVGLSGHLRSKPDALSGGMRQRVALARTLMEDRPIVLLDEPFSALDASTRADMQELTAEVLAGKTVLLVTHDPAEAVRLGNQIVVLASDAVTLWTTPQDDPIRDQFAAETVACNAQLLAYLKDTR